MTSIDADGQRRIESYPHVVVSSGRYCSPKIPAVPGIETFSGAKGVSHTFGFRGADHYRGQRVVVAGWKKLAAAECVGNPPQPVDYARPKVVTRLRLAISCSDFSRSCKSSKCTS